MLLLRLWGLHVQRGIWVPTQHLLWDQRTPYKTLIELAGLRALLPLERLGQLP
jgi:hypothetical protein